MQSLEVATFPIGPLQTNSYCIHNTQKAVVIDAGGDPAPILAFMQQHGLTVEAVLCTHLHFDHTYGMAKLHAATGATVYANQLDEYMLENELGKGGVWGFPPVEAFSFSFIEAGSVSLLGTTCTVLATPGHTPGGLSYYFSQGGCVFAGDTLFKRSIGRSDFPGGSQAVLEKSIKEQLFALPDETVVYAGHGPHTSIGDERRNNPFVSDFAS